MSARQAVQPGLLTHRLLGLGMGLLIGGDALYWALQLGSTAKLMSGLGWLALGTALALSAMPNRPSLSHLWRPQGPYALGPQWLRSVLPVGGMAAVLGGLVLRYALGL